MSLNLFLYDEILCAKMRRHARARARSVPKMNHLMLHYWGKESKGFLL